MILRYAWHLVSRNMRRTATYLFGLALAVGLFAGILFFVDATTRQMTATALAPVKLDSIARSGTPALNMLEVVTVLSKQRGVTAVEPFSVADFASGVKVGGTQGSPAGRLFAIAPSYFQTFDILQLSAGQFDAKGVVVSEAMAASQNLKLGDSVQLIFAGVDKPVILPVSGIVDLSSADVLFAAAGENSVVADVVFVHIDWFRANLLPSLAAYAANPPTSLPAGSVILDQQAHIKLDRTQLPADPAQALLYTDALRRLMERQFPGQLKVTDLLNGALKSAQADVLSAKILFIFLGLPGVALAAYLSKFAAELFAESQRRELGLLRTRGATPAQITAIVAGASALLAIGGSLLGILFGVVILFAGAGSQVSGSLNPLTPGFDWALFGGSALIAFLAGLVLTFLSAFLPAFGALRREITEERRTTRRSEGAPFWKRSYLDLLMMGAAAVVLVVTQLNGGFKPPTTEGAAISLSFYIFLAPLFAWIGLTLLTLRLVERGLALAARPIAEGFRRVFGEIGEVAGKSVARRAARVSAAATVIALTLSFGVSLALFQYTYSSEKRLDAQYVVGGDVRITPSLNTPQQSSLASALSAVPGVSSVTAVARDPQALIGSELNTVYGIDVASFRQTAYLPDSFFVDGSAPKTLDAMRNHTNDYAPASAQQVLAALAQTPNGVIISVEQAEKYNIQVGDPVLMRLYNRSAQTYSEVKAQAVGLFIYFPTSSQDSDFILNRDFMTQATGSSAMNFFLLKTNGQPDAVASVSQSLAAQYKNVLPVRIQNIETIVKADSSSLTSLNLGGLGAMERLYTLLVVSVGLSMFLLAMINERQREFGAMRALGANLRQLRRFLFVEAATIGGLSLVIGALVGVGLAYMLVLLLATIFTIPAAGLAWPGLELLVLGALVVVGMVASTWISSRRLATLKVVESLREE